MDEGSEPVRGRRRWSSSMAKGPVGVSQLLAVVRVLQRWRRCLRAVMLVIVWRQRADWRCGGWRRLVDGRTMRRLVIGRVEKAEAGVM